MRILGNLLLFCALFPFGAEAQYKDPLHRVQYRKFKWERLSTVAFHLYFPKGYDSLASFASVHLPDISTKIKADLGLHLAEAPSVIIYPSLWQAYESNIGSSVSEPQTFPTVHLQGYRSVLAFNGSYQEFRLQLSEAWLRLCLRQQFSSVLDSTAGMPAKAMPDWFEKGLIHFASRGWTVDDEAIVCKVWNGITDTSQAFVQAIEKNATLSGAAFCYYLSQRYRRDALRQLLVLLRQRKRFSAALRLLTKRNEETLMAECFDFFNRRRPMACRDIAPSTEELALNALMQQRNVKLHAHSFNTPQSCIAFVTEKNNTRELYIASTKSMFKEEYAWQSVVKYKLPPWFPVHENDPYPIIQWAADAKTLALVMPLKGKLRLLLFNEQGRQLSDRTLYGVDNVQSIVPSGRNAWIMSASRQGRSDIVQYDMQTLRFKLLSKSYAEHINISRDPYTHQLMYRSGFPADSLNYPDSLAKPYGLYRLHDEEEALWQKDSAWVRWYRSWTKGSTIIVDWNSLEGFHQKDTVPLSSMVDPAEATTSPWLQEYKQRLRYDDSIRLLLRKAASADEPSLLREILRPGNTEGAAAFRRDSMRSALAYAPRKKQPYLLQLHNAYFSAQVNNDYFINRYQPYAAYLGTFKFPELGAMLQGGFSDLFENHQISLGYRMPSGTEGSDFYTRYRNVASRLNWQFLFFRKVERLQPDAFRGWQDQGGNQLPAAAKVKTHYGELAFDYPLSYRSNIGFSTAIRRDQTIFLATDRYSLQFQSLNHWWSINTLSFSSSRLQKDLPMLYKGWEARTMLDGMLATGKNEAMLYGVYGRFALHQPLYRHINLSAAVQLGYSGGTQKILYNFGGIDNNLVPAVDTAVRFPQNAPYAFQSLVTPLRAWRQNSLYGSYFGLLNLDVYFPLFHTLIPLNTGFKVVNNFQIGLFADIAAAGGQEGLHPAAAPIYAWGYSMRTQLAGYGIRFDMGWPGAWSKEPVWYLSLIL
jgi:hypothetical protein